LNSGGEAGDRERQNAAQLGDAAGGGRVIAAEPFPVFADVDVENEMRRQITI
jgi:hypothetical protein